MVVLLHSTSNIDVYRYCFIRFELPLYTFSLYIFTRNSSSLWTSCCIMLLLIPCFCPAHTEAVVSFSRPHVEVMRQQLRGQRESPQCCRAKSTHFLFCQVLLSLTMLEKSYTRMKKMAVEIDLYLPFTSTLSDAFSWWVWLAKRQRSGSSLLPRSAVAPCCLWRGSSDQPARINYKTNKNNGCTFGRPSNLHPKWTKYQTLRGDFRLTSNLKSIFCRG